MRTNIKHIGAAVALTTFGVSMNAFGFLGFSGKSWKEEVLLHDGTSVVVERWQKRGGRQEISAGPPVKEHSITFAVPGTDKALTWRDEYSEDVGSANFVLLALHILNGMPYLVTSPYGCLSYNKSGRPNPPYVIFKHDGKAWERIPLSKLPSELKTINLVIGPSNEEKVLGGFDVVPATAIDKMNRRLTGPQYRSILRDPLPEKQMVEMCDVLVPYRGHWVQPNSAAGRAVIDGIIERQSK